MSKRVCRSRLQDSKWKFRETVNEGFYKFYLCVFSGSGQPSRKCTKGFKASRRDTHQTTLWGPPSLDTPRVPGALGLVLTGRDPSAPTEPPLRRSSRAPAHPRAPLRERGPPSAPSGLGVGPPTWQQTSQFCSTVHRSLQICPFPFLN